MTVADYADADPAVVKSGRVKKAVVNAVAKEGKAVIVFSVGLDHMDTNDIKIKIFELIDNDHV